MSRYQIEKGHDGPARSGILRFGNTKVPTPLLIGQTDALGVRAKYVTLPRTEKTQDIPRVVSLPSLLSGTLESTVTLKKTDLLLLPSVPHATTLEADDLLLKFQHDALLELEENIDPSRMIVRVPPGEALLSEHPIIQEFSTKGVQMASLVFNGRLGPDDINRALVRARLPVNWAMIALGRIIPSTLPVLYYLGFDLFDTGYAVESASKNVRLWTNGGEAIVEDIEPRSCGCVACSGSGDVRELSNLARQEVLLHHNAALFNDVLSECVHAKQSGRLRWLVESMTHASPSHASFIRRIDKQMYPFLEEFTPTTSDAALPLIGSESYNAPAVKRYRRTLIERYQPPDGKMLVILLPCSARKPYSDSRSHRRFLRTIESALRDVRGNVSEVILTSPLGVIPRELERVFPIANYDIPVTGEWDYEETKIAVDALTTHLSKFSKSAVIVAHVTGGYADVVRGAEDAVTQSIVYSIEEGSAASSASLHSLRTVLEDMKSAVPLEKGSPTILEETLRATADFQFGTGAGDLLVPEGAHLKGKLYFMVTCKVDGQQVCSYLASNGNLSLTLEGGRKLKEHGRYWVRLDAKEVRGGSIFAVGVNEADSNIRPGDEVIVLNPDDEVVAVGKSEMSGREMCSFNKGHAVSIRHKE